MIENNKKKNLSSSVVDTLRNRILNWTYLPGQRLTEMAICDEFNVSRSPAREALQKLIEQGLIVKMPNRGYEVKHLDIQEMENLYELRMALETYTAEKLAKRSSQPIEELERLRDAWRSFDLSTPPSAEEIAEKDRNFHDILAKALGNDVMYQQFRQINDRIALIRVMFYNACGLDKLDVLVSQHIEILDKIRAQDADGARKAMHRNIEVSFRELRRNLNDALNRAINSSDTLLSPLAPKK